MRKLLVLLCLILGLGISGCTDQDKYNDSSDNEDAIENIDGDEDDEVDDNNDKDDDGYEDDEDEDEINNNDDDEDDDDPNSF